MTAKKAQTLDLAVFSVVNKYGFNGFPNGDWRSGTNPVLVPIVSRLHALRGEAFDSFSRTESDLTRDLPGFHREAFTNFYEFLQEKTLEFSLASFTEFFEIAKANRKLVPDDPTWWAHAQAHALLCQELGVPQRSTGFPFWRIRGWIQYFCDGKIPADVIDAADLETTESFLRIATRSDWRAPKWLWAWARKYYGRHSAEWDSLKTEAASMEQLDQQKTEKLLNTITERLWLYVDYRFCEIVARVHDAKSDSHSPDEAVGKTGIAITESPKTGAISASLERKATNRPQDRLAKARREEIRKISPKIKGEAYCKALGNLPTPIPWQKNENCPKRYLDAYWHSDPTERKKWRDRIWDERYKARKNTQLANTRKERVTHNIQKPA